MVAPVEGVTEDALDDTGVETTSADAVIGWFGRTGGLVALSGFLLKKLNNVPCLRLLLLEGVFLDDDFDDMAET